MSSNRNIKGLFAPRWFIVTVSLVVGALFLPALARQSGWIAKDSTDLIIRSGFETGETAPRPCIGRESDGDGDGFIDLPCTKPFTPPDPATVATPIDPTVPVIFHEIIAFLYSGPQPVQRGLRPDAIQPYRVAVIRGLVKDDSGAPLPGVLVRVLGQADVGYTYTRADGIFDIAVNGGGEVVVDYVKSGYLRAQRKVDAPWGDWAWVDDTRMIQLDPAVETITTGPGAPQQLSRGSVVTDVDGTRRLSLIWPAGVTAELVFADGSRQPAPTLNVRATEYTVGPDGRERMPGPLPATTAYTYAVELSADEAIAAGAESVEFSAPVIAYLENFLAFPIGVEIPAGTYRFRYGQWLPEDDGRVVRLLSVTGGLANLDVDGSGVAATPAQYAELGIDAAERARVATLFTVGAELWRSPIAHFTPWDLNLPFVPNDEDTAPPDPGAPDDDDGSDNGDDPESWDGEPCDSSDPSCLLGEDRGESDESANDDVGEKCQTGSIIGCETGSLRDSIPLPGTGLSLRYDSRLTPAVLEDVQRFRRVRVTGDTVPVTLARALLDVEGTGVRISRAYLQPGANLFENIERPTTDAYGRPWPSASDRFRIRVTYEYPARFARTTLDVRQRAWARFTQEGSLIGGIRQNGTYFLAREYRGRREGAGYWGTRRGAAWDARGQGFGGWTLSGHHVLDARIGKLFGGGLAGRSVESAMPSRVESTRTLFREFSPAQIQGASRMAAAPDGSLVLLGHAPTPGIGSELGRNGIWRYRVDGQRELWANLCDPTYNAVCEKQGYANQAVATDVAVDSRGLIWVADGRRILRFTEPGQFTIAFDGASEAQPCSPTRLIAHDARTYFSCTTNSQSGWVGTIWPDGQVDKIVGGGTEEVDGTFPERLRLRIPDDLAIDPSGRLFVSDIGARRVWRIDPNGRVEGVLGSAGFGFAPDGSPAKTSPAGGIVALATTADGRILFQDDSSKRLRQIGQDGILRTIAGGGTKEIALIGTGGGAIGRGLQFEVNDFTLLPDGTTAHVSSRGGDSQSTVAALSQSTFASFQGYRTEPGEVVVPSTDGSAFMVFDARGRHLVTRRSDTGGLIRRFEYNAAGYLTGIVDPFGNRVIVERSGPVASAIVSADGVRTTLQINAAGFLTRVTTSEAQQWEITPRSDGLMTQMTKPNGGTTQFQWFRGQLTQHTDAESALRTLARTDWRSRQTTQRTLTSAEGRSSRYAIDRTRNGAVNRVTERAGEPRVEDSRTSSGRQRTEISPMPAPGRAREVVRIETRSDVDPRFGAASVYAASTRVTMERYEMSVTPNIALTRVESYSRGIEPVVAGAGLGQLDIEDVRTINGRTYRIRYDALTRTYSRQSPAGRIASMTLNEHGQPILVNVPGLAAVDYQYDSRGRLVAVGAGSGSARRSTTYAYDNTGYLRELRDPELRTVVLTNDTVGRTTRVSLPDSRQIDLRYTADDRIGGVTPPGRGEHAFEYDRLGQLKRYVPPTIAGLARTDTRYSWTPDRDLSLVDRPDGIQVPLTYGATTGLLEATGDPLTPITYPDRAGRWLTQANAPGWQVRLSWIGDLLSGAAQGPAGNLKDVVYGYDSNFWLVGVSSPIAPGRGVNTAYTYDDDGLLTAATSREFAPPPVGAGPPLVLNLQRSTQNGLLTAVSNTGTRAVSENWTYNEFAEPVGYTATLNGAPLYAWTATRDKLGRITRRTETIDGTTTITDYRYDLAGRLDQVDINGVLAADYAYDSNSNRLSVTRGSGAGATTESGTYDAQDRLLTYAGHAYTWTANGELATRTHVASGAQLTTVYDSHGNLREATLPDGRVVAYTADGFHRRVQKRINGTLVQQFLYLNQLEPIAELDGAGNVVANFVYADRAHVPSLMRKDSRWYRIVSDQLGSVRLVVDLTDGTIAQRLDYDEFGRVLTDTQPGFQPFGYAGGIYDRDTGLVRFGARDYDPGTGRWTAKDPIGFRGGDANLYAYSQVDPVNLVDVTGLDVCVHRSATGFRHEWVSFDRDPSRSYGAWPAEPGLVSDTLILNPDGNSREMDDEGTETQCRTSSPAEDSELERWINETYDVGPLGGEKNPTYILGVQDCRHFVHAVIEQLEVIQGRSAE